MSFQKAKTGTVYPYKDKPEILRRILFALLEELVTKLKNSFHPLSHSEEKLLQNSISVLRKLDISKSPPEGDIKDLVKALEPFYPPYCTLSEDDNLGWGFWPDLEKIKNGIEKGIIILAESPDTMPRFVLMKNEVNNFTLYGIKRDKITLLLKDSDTIL